MKINSLFGKLKIKIRVAKIIKNETDVIYTLFLVKSFSLGGNNAYIRKANGVITPRVTNMSLGKSRINTNRIIIKIVIAAFKYSCVLIDILSSPLIRSEERRVGK